MKVKICGITSASDARAAAEAGADAVGLNFVGGPRQIDPERAEQILSAMPAFVVPVALVDVSAGRIPGPLVNVLESFRVSHLQLYGQVAPKTVAHLANDGFRPLLVRHVRAGEFPATTQSYLRQCGTDLPSAILLDAYHAARQGGTGRAVDWARIAEARDAGALDGWPPIMLAGGLTPDNVAEAISIVRPWGVDVSSGVEQSPGCKSAERMRAFVTAASRSSFVE